MSLLELREAAGRWKRCWPRGSLLARPAVRAIERRFAQAPDSAGRLLALTLSE